MSTDNTGRRVVLDYTSRDYKSIRSMLVGLAKGFMPDWITVGEAGDFGTLLLELFAYTGDIMNYYIDRVGSEAFLGTAARRQSVMYIADMFGYRAMGQRAATVPVTFTWTWDTENLPAGLIPVYTYSVSSATASGGVASLELTSDLYTINIVPGQTITVEDLGAPFDGRFVVTSVTPKTPSNPFKVTYKAASSGEVTATIEGTSAVSTGNVVIIPEKTVVQSVAEEEGGSYSFETDFAVVLDSAAGKQVDEGSTVYRVTAQTTASEGTTVPAYLLGTSQGIPNAEFVIEDLGVIDRTVTVYTKENGQVIPWSRVDKLSLASPTQSVFTTYVDDENATHVMFGDNASGRIPPANMGIYVGYRYGVGAAANSVGINGISVLNNEYATALGVTVSNVSSPLGGADVESIESMRYSIPRSNILKQRAVTLEDYVSLALQVPGVTKATAYGSNYTAVYVRVASGPQSEGYLSNVVTGKYVDSGVATITVANDWSLINGQVIYLDNVDVDLDGTARTTAVYSTTSPSVINKKQLISNTVTLTTVASHGLRVGQPITVSNVGDEFNGNHIITAVTANTLTYKNTDSNVAETVVSNTAAVVRGCAGFSFDTGASNSSPLELEVVTEPADATATITDPSSQILITATEDYLANKKLIGSVVYGEPVEWTNADIDITVRVRPLYNRTNVRNSVQNAVRAVFDYSNVDFGRRISIGDVYRAALSVDGVDYITLNTLKKTGTTGPVEDINSSDPEDPNGDSDNAYRIPRINPTLGDAWVHATGGLANT